MVTAPLKPSHASCNIACVITTCATVTFARLVDRHAWQTVSSKYGAKPEHGTRTLRVAKSLMLHAASASVACSACEEKWAAGVGSSMPGA